MSDNEDLFAYVLQTSCSSDDSEGNQAEREVKGVDMKQLFASRKAAMAKYNSSMEKRSINENTSGK